MPWLYLLVAGLLEIAWAASMKASQGFTILWPSVFTILGQIASFVLLALAMRDLPLGTAYGVWTGIGAAGAAVIGIVYFGDSANLLRLACVAVIVAGIIGLKIVG